MTDGVIPFGPFARAHPELQALLNDPDKLISSLTWLRIASWAPGPVTIEPKYIAEVLAYIDRLEEILSPGGAE